jgi:hypothetical protein
LLAPNELIKRLRNDVGLARSHIFGVGHAAAALVIARSLSINAVYEPPFLIAEALARTQQVSS